MITLNSGQEAALSGITSWAAVQSDSSPIAVLNGGPGTGKSTMISQIVDSIEAINGLRKLMGKAVFQEVQLAATTNKAVESLAQATHIEDIQTFHSLFEIRIDNRSGKPQKVYATPHKMDNTMFIVDEFSTLEEEDLAYMTSRIGDNSAVLFVGDKDQMLPHLYFKASVTTKNFPTFHLWQTERYPPESCIGDVVRMFRDAIDTKIFEPVDIDGTTVCHYPADQVEAYQKEILGALSNGVDARIVAWRNKTVIAYNQWVLNEFRGTKYFAPGDQVVINHHHTVKGYTLRNEQVLTIKAVHHDKNEQFLKQGMSYELEGIPYIFFVPDEYSAKRKVMYGLEQGVGNEDLKHVRNFWVDLRPTFSSTVNKSQGITCDTVFVDVQDISRCNSKSTIARLMNVACSRARKRVVLFGDL